MIIYKATNKINNKCYIGQTTKDLEYRIKNHIKESTGNRCGWLFHKALKKYGSENFKWTILEYCYSSEELNNKEIWYIKHFKSFGEKGYNLTDGGKAPNGHILSSESKDKIRKANLGKKQTEETKNKRSKSLKGRVPWNKGKPSTNEHRKHVSEGMIGRKFSEETKLKISIANTGFVPTEETRLKLSKINKGKKLSDETRNKMSLSRKGINKGLNPANFMIKKECPYCNKIMNIGNFTKYHGDKCKNKH